MGAVAIGVLGAVVALASVSAASARNEMLAARDAMERGRSALLGGDVTTAAERFGEAQDAFIRASGSARSLPLHALSAIPVVGRTPDAIAAMADAGRQVAEAGATLTGTIERIGGLEALAPSHGRLPLARLPVVARAAENARALIGSALAEVERTGPALLASPVADARTEALGQLTKLDDTLRNASTILSGLPAILGAEGERRYFFGAQNPAELRGTGGYLGTYAIVTMSKGAMRFSAFRPIQSLPNEPRLPPAPNRDFARIYDQYGSRGFWPNVNMSPDVPSTAVAIERLWDAGGGAPLDGVILADPFALRSMLEATGPVPAPSLGTTLTADTVIPFTTNEVYSTITDPTKRKLALGIAAQAVFQRFMAGTADPTASASALLSVVSGGHLLVATDDAPVQRAFEATGVGGALTSSSYGDLLSVVLNNGGGNKVDYYLDRTVDYSVQLGADGTSSGTVRVDLSNHAPLRGEPSYVLGPFPGVSRRGEDVPFVWMYCARSCTIGGRSVDLMHRDLGPEREQGLPIARDYLRIPSGERATLRYSVSTTDAWRGDEYGGTYDFTFLNQPTIRPTSLRLSVQVPAGMHITSTSVPMRVSGSSAVLQGVPGRTFHLEIAFQPSLVERFRHSVWRFLTMPLIP